VALSDSAGSDGTAVVHLGKNFPLTWTSKTTEVAGKLWCEAAWQTPSRHGTGWLPASAVTAAKPTEGAQASFDALDPSLAAYLASLGTRIGVDVFDETRGVTYTFNADRSFFCASSVKVPIMLTFLSQIEAQGREPTSTEYRLLRTMIENSDNRSADRLYEKIGAQAGINAFMREIGLSGLVPNKPGWWGHSTITPATMVALLTRLHQGTILTEAHRLLALGYMEHVDSLGRVGVGDSSPAGATIAMKDGWTGALDGTGTYVVNTSGIVTLGAETYIISVYTDHDRSYGEGWKIIRQVCRLVGQDLIPTA
jgi:beta-lactamase class A